MFGASGIIGQYMQASAPGPKVSEILAYSLTHFNSFDLSDEKQIKPLLSKINPDVIINLAGENRVDIIEQSLRNYFKNSDISDYYKQYEYFYRLNVVAPRMIAEWASVNRKFYLHVSTQGVFEGNSPPYRRDDTPHPINEYGKQKWLAEEAVKTASAGTWKIARLTFVLGVRLAKIGRRNPFEQMCEDIVQRQVSDRYFSVAFADDAAHWLWEMVAYPDRYPSIVHIGTPVKTSRYKLATTIQVMKKRTLPARQIMAVNHADFLPACAERPLDTTWHESAYYSAPYIAGLEKAVVQWEAQ